MRGREKLRTFALAIACILLSAVALPVRAAAKARASQSNVTAEAGAVVSVEGTAPLAAGTMRENARIHPNRDYTFVSVPPFIRGWAFTSHQHKNPAALTCRVKAPGRVYLCLQPPATPGGLGLAGTWTPCGKLDTVIRGRSYPWTIYRADVTAGATLTVPSPDRWGAVVAVRKIDALKTAARGAPGRTRRKPSAKPTRASQSRRAGTSQSSTDEYGHLAADIRNRAWSDRIAAQAFDKQALILKSDRDPLDVVLRRTAALLADLTAAKDAPDLAKEANELQALGTTAGNTPPTDGAARGALFDKACKLRRRIAFANPLLNFDRLLFIKRHDPGGPFHMCDQYYGCNARPGGGLFVLSDPFGPEPRATDLLAGSLVESGRLKGQKLTGGSFLSPELSFDGKTILFAWTQAKARKTYTWGPTISYHIFKCNADPSTRLRSASLTAGGAGGRGLVQLTDGDADDFDPCFLPGGRVAFISLRRGGYLRCGRHCPVYAMFSMAPDGGDIIPLSYHETHEWQPSVDNDGMIVYTRWDYVDRDTNVAHHIWISYPDGRDPRSFHGNYPAVRNRRPWMEMEIRAIPGSHRYVAVTGAHHGNAIGSLVLIDQRVEDDNAMSQVKRLTPEAPFPESEGSPRRCMRYGTPWPLSETYYLCVYDADAKNRGIYLIDRFGNRELLYRDGSISCLSPIPLRPRPKPPVIPEQTVQTAAATKAARASQSSTGRQPLATVAVMNIYDADFTWPKGMKIKSLRIIQLLPKSNPTINRPRIGAADAANARAVLGTVPVEPDGSVHFEAPVAKPFYFQALDARGLAVQSMRSVTYVHPGERLTCRGCHEPKLVASPFDKAPALPSAMRRAPSKLKPDVDGSNPFNYPRLVQPVLDRHCVKCHIKNKGKKAPNLAGTITRSNGWTQSYVSLAGKYGFYFHSFNGCIRTGVHGGTRTVPGKFGARASRLFQMLEKGHHKVKLPAEDLYRITLWLDCNSDFYGAYHSTAAQARGEIVRPDLE